MTLKGLFEINKPLVFYHDFWRLLSLSQHFFFLYKNLSKTRKLPNPVPIFLCWILRTLGTRLSLTSRPDTNIDYKAWLIYRWPLVVPVNIYGVQPSTLGIFFWMDHRKFKAFLAINLVNGLWKFFRCSILIWNCILFYGDQKCLYSLIIGSFCLCLTLSFKSPS